MDKCLYIISGCNGTGKATDSYIERDSWLLVPETGKKIPGLLVGNRGIIVLADFNLLFALKRLVGLTNGYLAGNLLNGLLQLG